MRDTCRDIYLKLYDVKNLLRSNLSGELGGEDVTRMAESW